MSSERFRRGEMKDYGMVAQLYASCLSALPSGAKPSQEDQSRFLSHLEQALEERRVFVLLEQQKCIGFAEISHSIGESFFPASPYSPRVEDILEQSGYQGEDTLVLRQLFVLPSKWRHGYGGQMMQSLLARHKDASWYALLAKENVAGSMFLKSQRFSPLCYAGEVGIEDEDAVLFVRRYVPEGLCREARW